MVIINVVCQQKNSVFCLTQKCQHGYQRGLSDRKIRLSVDFHRFVTCHWMSNAKQHGAELVADSFQLRMCNRLVLVPIEDGLLHRPRADWSIKYLTCHLGPTQIYLCQEARLNEVGHNAKTNKTTTENS